MNIKHFGQPKGWKHAGSMAAIEQTLRVYGKVPLRSQLRWEFKFNEQSASQKRLRHHNVPVHTNAQICAGYMQATGDVKVRKDFSIDRNVEATIAPTFYERNFVSSKAKRRRQRAMRG